jgi:hypothetical protein
MSKRAVVTMESPPAGRIFHPVDRWEEAPMWRRTPVIERDRRSRHARAILTNDTAFRVCLGRVIQEWPVSCEHNLTDNSLNRAAWLWHAGSYLETGASEEVTRSIWSTLTNAERKAADRIAWEVVAEWERNHAAMKQRQCQRDLWD